MDSTAPQATTDHNSPDTFLLRLVIVIVSFVSIVYLIRAVVRYMTSSPPPPLGLGGGRGGGGGGGGGGGDIELGIIRDRVRVEDTRTVVFRSAADTPHTQDMCPVCLSEYEVGEELCSLPPCTHTFHPSCTRKFMVRETRCPVCRRPISLPYDDEEGV